MATTTHLSINHSFIGRNMNEVAKDMIVDHNDLSLVIGRIVRAALDR
jgi:hypothetical protein